jgi:hypothetical protein
MKLTNRTGRVPTWLSDIAFLVVAVVGMPLWIFLLLAYAGVVVGRHLYWWARGNTTGSSRVLSAIATERPRTQPRPDPAGSPPPRPSAWSPTWNPTGTRTP